MEIKRMNKLVKELKQWLKALIIAVAVVFVINIFFAPMTVYGVSMNPTLDDKDVLILLKNTNYERGDIVSFKSDLVVSERNLNDLSLLQKLYLRFNPNMDLIKRVIAIPGDSVQIENGEVFVNSVKLDEVYLGSFTTGTILIEQISPNEYFLMGDNRSNSIDSRSDSVGTINADQIVGEVLFRVYPLSKVGQVD